MHLLHTSYSKQVSSSPLDPDLEDTSKEQDCHSQKKLNEIFELVMKSQNDIKLLKKQHEEMKNQFALLNEAINSQLLNLSSLFSSMAIQSTSNGIQLHDIGQQRIFSPAH